MWYLLDETVRGEELEAMKEASLDSRVEGAKENKAVVQARETEMLFGEDGLMMYHIGIYFCLLPFARDIAYRATTSTP